MWHHVRQEIKKGVKVKVVKPKWHLNGTEGVVKGQNKDKRRWDVEFENDGNLITLEPGELETEMVPCPRGDKCNDLTARCGRDRYPSLICSSGSRVRLSDDAYINANYIRYPDYALRMSGRHEQQNKGDLVVTQGPMDGADTMKVKGKKIKGKQQPDKVEKCRYKWPKGHVVPPKFAKDDWEFKDTQPQFWQMVRFKLIDCGYQ